MNLFYSTRKVSQSPIYYKQTRKWQVPNQELSFKLNPKHNSRRYHLLVSSGHSPVYSNGDGGQEPEGEEDDGNDEETISNVQSDVLHTHHHMTGSWNDNSCYLLYGKQLNEFLSRSIFLSELLTRANNETI